MKIVKTYYQKCPGIKKKVIIYPKRQESMVHAQEKNS